MSQSAPLTNEQLQVVLAEVWQKSVPVLRERVEVLQRAVEAFAAGTLTSQLNEQAGDEAHRLAGLLGTFGYPEGTDAARGLELVFEPKAGPMAGEPQGPRDAKPDVEQMRAGVALLRKITGA